MGLLDNKVAIITGASSGIGYATALLFAKEGASVVVAARRQTELDNLVLHINKLGGKAYAVAGSVVDEATAKKIVDIAVLNFGGVDICFNNAGTLGDMGPTPKMSLESWQTTLNTNLTSAFLGAKYQIPAMLERGSGSLIFTSTFVGHTVGFPGVAAYAASKAGLIGLTQVLAAEFGPNNIRVNALLPGGTNTPMAAQMNNSPEALEHVANLHALKRIAEPNEIANAALFLASQYSSFVTGSSMLVDGGVSINRS